VLCVVCCVLCVVCCVLCVVCCVLCVVCCVLCVVCCVLCVVCSNAVLFPNPPLLRNVMAIHGPQTLHFGML
jgi:hypothetical protein